MLQRARLAQVRPPWVCIEFPWANRAAAASPDSCESVNRELGVLRLDGWRWMWQAASLRPFVSTFHSGKHCNNNYGEKIARKINEPIKHIETTKLYITLGRNANTATIIFECHIMILTMEAIRWKIQLIWNEQAKSTFPMRLDWRPSLSLVGSPVNCRAAKSCQITIVHFVGFHRPPLKQTVRINLSASIWKSRNCAKNANTANGEQPNVAAYTAEQCGAWTPFERLNMSEMKPIAGWLERYKVGLF